MQTVVNRLSFKTYKITIVDQKHGYKLLKQKMNTEILMLLKTNSNDLYKLTQ